MMLDNYAVVLTTVLVDVHVRKYGSDSKPLDTPSSLAVIITIQ